MKKCGARYLIFLILVLSVLPILIPIWIMLSGSFIGTKELSRYLFPIFNKSSFLASWVLLPQYPTLQPLIELLLDTPEFFTMFWNTCKTVFPAVMGQFLIATPTAWSFAFGHWRYKKSLYFLYVILMIMPFQVTMASSYIVLSHLNLLDSLWAVILPNCFSTFPVFIISRFFVAIPKSFVDAASLDGANHFQTFTKIGIPLGLPGIICALTLGFFETWSAIEQPMLFLQKVYLWPLSLYLPQITTSKIGISFAASLVSLLPPLLLFFIGKDYLIQGLSSSYSKE